MSVQAIVLSLGLWLIISLARRRGGGTMDAIFWIVIITAACLALLYLLAGDATR